MGNHLVVSTEWLKNNLDFCDSRLTHLPGDIFGSRNTAALAWGLTFYRHSNRLQREFGSNILAGGGGYFFDQPNIGDRTSVPVRDPDPGQTRVAIIHSHPRADQRFGTQ